MYQFEKLDVWQKSVDLVATVYAQTKNFPEEEKFGLTNQLRRAAVSVVLNIAEGRGKLNDKEFCRFIDIASGSLFEVISGFKVAERLGYAESESLVELYELSDEVGAKLRSLHNKLGKGSDE